MELRSLSASSARVYELCPSRYQVEYEQRGGSAGGEAANLGTACHHAFLRFVEEGLHLEPQPSSRGLSQLHAFFDEKYYELFVDNRRREEGRGLCAKWLKRQDWDGREVLLLEEKHELTLDTRFGPIPFRYIMDRKDRLDGGDIEVVDYKSVSMPIAPEALRDRIQSRAYAWAAFKEHPEATFVWVTFDLLRYEPISLRFTRQDAEDTEVYLIHLAERIIEDDIASEVLNGECRFCPKANSCVELNRVMSGRIGVLAHMSPNELLDNRWKLEHAKGAVTAMLTEVDTAVKVLIEQSGEEELETAGYVATLSSGRRRVVDTERLAKALTPEQFAELDLSVGVTSIDELLRSGDLDPETASLVRQAVTWKHNAPSVKVKERA